MARIMAVLVFLCFSLMAVSVVSANESPEDFVKATIAGHPVVIFSKSYCPYCRRAKQVFSQLDVKPFVVELDQRDDGQDIQNAVSSIVGRRTVPQVFVNSRHIGGSDDTVAAFESGKLERLVSKTARQEL